MVLFDRIRILLVEDDPTVARVLSRALRRLEPAWEFDFASTVEDAILRGSAEPYDFIAIDWNLGHPTLTGLDVCRELRNNGISAVLAMLTVRSDVDDRVAAITAGADDHIVKSDGIDEIRAQIKVDLARRTADYNPDKRPDLPRGPDGKDAFEQVVATRGGPRTHLHGVTAAWLFRRLSSIGLSVHENLLLAKLAERSPGWVTTPELALALGRHDDAGAMLIRQHIRQLRKKLRRRGVRIESRPGRGYRLVRIPSRRRTLAV